MDARKVKLSDTAVPNSPLSSSKNLKLKLSLKTAELMMLSQRLQILHALAKLEMARSLSVLSNLWLESELVIETALRSDPHIGNPKASERDSNLQY